MARRKRPQRRSPTKETKHVRGADISINAASPGSRFLAGVLDFVFLLCGSTLLAITIGGSPFFFYLSASYFIDLNTVFTILTDHSALLSLVILLLLSFVYFILEGMIGLSFGKYIFGCRIAGKRTLRKAITRSIVKSIPVVSLIDFLFVYKNLKYTQRCIDRRLELSVAKLTKRTRKKTHILDEKTRAYLTSGIIMFFLPLVTFIVYDVMTSASSGSVFAPAPDSNFDYEPSLDFLLAILINNIYLAYSYYLFGGLFLCLPMVLQLFFQGLTAGTLMSGVIRSYPQFLIFGVFPHLIVESLGFSILIASGLKVSETVLDLFMLYRKGDNIALLRDFLHVQFIFILKSGLLGGLILLVGSWIEVYVTPLVLISFYFC